MKNWWKDFKIKSAMNSRTASIRKLTRQIEMLEQDSEDNQRMIKSLKSRMFLIDGNQLDLFDK